MSTDKLNLKTRTKILEYALNLEDSVNVLLKGHLAIFNDQKTKHFGNKAGLTFKNKIDLLYDLKILNQEEVNDLDLLMSIRNRFLHDINCTSFSVLLNSLDNGIVNRFNKNLPNDLVAKKEKDYEEACMKLYIKNVKTLMDKFAKRRENLESKRTALIELSESYLLLLNKSFDTIDDLIALLEDELVLNPNQSEFISKIMNRCNEFINNKELKNQTEKIGELFNDDIIRDLLK